MGKAQKEHYERNKEAVKKKVTLWIKSNPDAWKKIRMNSVIRRRMIVLRHYSKSQEPFCNCCGEKHYEFLAVDHINGNPNKKIRGGGDLVRFLIKNNFPDGFQILCHNCNLAKGFYGICPHITEETCS